MKTKGLSNTGAPKSFYATVAALVVPMALQNLINVAVQSADVIMLGQVGEISLSAASLAGQIQFVLMMMLFGLASGASVLTAQYWGKGDMRAIEKITSIALRASLLLALVFMAAVYITPHGLMRIFTPEADVISEGVKYLQLVAPSYLIMAVTVVYLNIMRSVEKVIVSTVTYSISLLANIGFNSIFIFGLLGAPKMGVAGAALGTTLARCVELIIVAIYAARNPLVRLRIKDYVRTHKVLLLDFRKYALPTTINELLWSTGVSAYAVIIGHMGRQVVAANSVAQVVRQLATVVSFGIANAAAIMIGKAIGAGNPKQALDYSKRILRVALVTGCVGAVLILVLRPFIPGFVNISSQAKEYLLYQLILMSGYVILQTINATAIVGIFRGGGDTRTGLILDAGCMWGFSILFGFLAAFVFHWPVRVVLVIILLDEVIKVPLCLLRYKSKRWLRNVTRNQIEE